MHKSERGMEALELIPSSVIKFTVIISCPICRSNMSVMNLATAKCRKCGEYVRIRGSS